MKNQSILKIEKLLKKGVKIPNPDSIEIGSEVDTDRISGEGVVIYSGCKIFGSSTLILKNTRMGYESPVTIENCQIGTNVDIKGGFLREAVLLDKVSIGYGSHIREGTILEEEANIAHMVGLKHTILLPFVTLGSLINFCDCFMSGGTSKKDHSEVGSSYIHFNYTPNQDKATASLVGDVPNGVMLNQRPIFLGGQGGIVGPCRLAFGTVTAAGSICRKDELRPNRLIFEGLRKSGNIPFTSGMYRSLKRIMVNNIIYIANLIALMQWYLHVRSKFISSDFPDVLFEGLKEKLNMVIDERIGRLKDFCQNKGDFYEIEESFNKMRLNEGDRSLRDTFLKHIDSGIQKSGMNYISVIKGLENTGAELGTKWLQEIVDSVTEGILNHISLK
ncbi:MAG: protein GlmU [Proteobacteria bacterium]|nr:protein GlmU [Pseudomonadota bacterium]MBU4258262.1 protein GlmU [Pseudomonadota bacterium]MBU4288110.1 protein GlmU [Pseudomonadota bacterium]MBU4414082.1 protein GlmU [Pseudomonadota bacterium]MCG2757099.1 protein GlmU [Desulfobacteraceae bacterium]